MISPVNKKKNWNIKINWGDSSFTEYWIAKKKKDDDQGEELKHNPPATLQVTQLKLKGKCRVQAATFENIF